MTKFDQSDRRVFLVGQKVRFTEEYLSVRPVTAKTLAGRVGEVSGYRMGAADPIVTFPKDGRRKEQKVFEAQSSGLVLVE